VVLVRAFGVLFRLCYAAFDVYLDGHSVFFFKPDCKDFVGKIVGWSLSIEERRQGVYVTLLM